MGYAGFDIEGKRITVVGAARSGVAVALLLAQKGVQVFVTDAAPRNQKQDAARQLDESGIPFEFGGHTSRALKADLLVVSPGMPMQHPFIQSAVASSIDVVGELEVASWFCRAPIVAVTGSNGKSTVTALLGALFEAAGRPCVVAGNIGSPFSGSVLQTTEAGVAVLEVSSFQLETIRTFKPVVSVFLNLTPDHLDRHGDMAVYGRLKARIFMNQTREDIHIFNAEDQAVSALSSAAHAQCLSFGIQKGGDRQGYLHNGNLILRLHADEEILLSVNDMTLKGRHNAANALAAGLAARVMDVEARTIGNVLHTFRGLPHRMEAVREFDGVLWINDSKATNVDSVWYALGSYPRPVILIAGGRDKDSDFNRLRDRIRESTRGIILMGEAAEKMEKALSGIVPILRAESLRDAVRLAQEMAKPGDVVLLSPGCASFDMFDHFEDRGEQFKKLVKER